MGAKRSSTFGERLRHLREAAGLTQEELAAEAGMTSKGIGALERGERRRPYPHTVRSLADTLAYALEKGVYRSKPPGGCGWIRNAGMLPAWKAREPANKPMKMGSVIY